MYGSKYMDIMTINHQFHHFVNQSNYKNPNSVLSMAIINSFRWVIHYVVTQGVKNILFSLVIFQLNAIDFEISCITKKVLKHVLFLDRECMETLKQI